MRMNPILLILGAMAAAVGGWGMFTVMTEVGQAPAFIAVISIAIFELFAVGLGIHAVKVAGDGDSPFVFNLGIVLIAITAAVVQFVGAIVEGKGVLFGIVMAMAPIAAITLWVVEMRRYFRIRGRAAGTVAQPPATIEPMMWVRFPKQAAAAKRFALVDRTLGADDAMKLGLLATQQKPGPVVPARVARNIAIESVVPELANRPAVGSPRVELVKDTAEETSKRDRALALLAEQPELTPEQIAERVPCSARYVRKLREDGAA